jgi:hypothetical protein
MDYWKPANQQKSIENDKYKLRKMEKEGGGMRENTGTEEVGFNTGFTRFSSQGHARHGVQNVLGLV